MNFGGREDKHDMTRGFLECLQQRIERRIGEHVDFIDDVDPVPASEVGKIYIISNLSNIINAGVGGPVNFNDVDRVTLSNIHAIDTGIAGSAGRATLTIKGLGQNTGNRCFSDAPGSGKEKGMRDPFGGNGIHQSLHHMTLSDHVIERGGAVFSG